MHDHTDKVAYPPTSYMCSLNMQASLIHMYMPYYLDLVDELADTVEIPLAQSWLLRCYQANGAMLFILNDRQFTRGSISLLAITK